MSRSLEIMERIDQAIKNVWENRLKTDYNHGFLLLEDSLKGAFYHHLRNELGDNWLVRHRIRIYPEFHLSKGRRADIAIVKVTPRAFRKTKH